VTRQDLGVSTLSGFLLAVLEETMRTLDIIWQRLVKGGQTCSRCGATGEAVQRAVETLDEVLRPLDIKPVLRTVEIDEESFTASPTESNRIVIAGKSLEDWTGGATGNSHCSSVCGEHQCRTVEIDGVAFESVPEWLIVKAALLAAAAQLPEQPDPCGGSGAHSSCSEPLSTLSTKQPLAVKVSGACGHVLNALSSA
jgi:hypothetical protein